MRINEVFGKNQGMCDRHPRECVIDVQMNVCSNNLVSRAPFSSSPAAWGLLQNLECLLPKTVSRHKCLLRISVQQTHVCCDKSISSQLSAVPYQPEDRCLLPHRDQ